MNKPVITIERFLLDTQPEYAKGDLTAIFYDLAMAGKMIAAQTRRAGLLDILGYHGSVNIQGEQQRTLDVYADEVVIGLNNRTGRLCAMASEEQEDWIPIPDQYPKGNYVMVYDPLDGSSNIDINVSIGTIFGIFHTVDETRRGRLEDCLQPARNMIAAGYILYGTSTMLVYSAGQGVHGFTLDPELGEFLLTHENLRFPETPTYYSLNLGAYPYWTPGERRYADWLNTLKTPRLSQRYIGSLVADFHRNLLYGGIYVYIGEDKYPEGKIRLLYEAGPIAFLAQQAGGYASDGKRSLLDIVPITLHQRTPIFVGNTSLVRKAEEIIAQSQVG